MKRVEDLEVKTAFLEKQVDELDAMVRRALDALEHLHREVEALRAQRSLVSERGGLEEEVPPHHDRLPG